jgi:hypothetical protein
MPRQFIPRPTICQHCGETFQARNPSNANRFCSRACHDAHRWPPLRERFLAKIIEGAMDECWEWQGSRDHLGYGHIRRSKGESGSILAHRVSYELFNGPIPEGLDIRHRCDNPPCVNPHHLEPGTVQDNMRDMHTRGRRGRNATTRSDAKLTDDQVREIRQRWELGGTTQRTLAAEYNVTQPLISLVVRRKLRAHVG